MATQLFQPPHGSPAWFHSMVKSAGAQPKMEVVSLDAALAKTLLDQNDGNRGTRAA